VRSTALALAVALAAGCGDDGATVDARPQPVCGNMMVEAPEQCDDGNTDETDACRRCVAFLPHRTLIRWLFDADMTRGFAGDGCVDVGASSVRVELTGAQAATLTVPCERFQATFEGLAAGDYTAAVTPIDASGATLVTAPATTTFTASAEPNATEQHTVEVPYTAWSRPLTGTFLFILRWAGHDCATSSPRVATQRVKMTIGGAPVTTVTQWNNQPGYRLDGTQTVPCVPSTIALAERAAALPLGPATLEVEGKDSGGTIRYGKTFETFVGAGTANPVYTFDVTAPVDAGVDAMVDAPIDAP